MEEEKKKEKKCFRPRGEMNLLVSRVRGLKEPAHNCRQGGMVMGVEQEVLP